MKTLILLLLTTQLSFAQFADYERLTLSVNTEPQAYINDGLNIGLDLELQNKWFYIGVGTYQFPNLNDIGYSQYHSNIGLNYRNPKDNIRLYLGGLGGLVFREGNANTILGIENGIEYYFGRFGVGLEWYYAKRRDAVYFDGEQHSFNGQIKFIYKIK